MSTTHAMADSNDRTGHLITLQVDKIEKISGMIEPAGVIPQTVLVDNTALALMRYISHPDTPDAKSIGF